MDITKREKRKLRWRDASQKAPEIGDKSDPKPVHEHASKRLRLHIIGVVIGILMLAIITYSVYSASRPSAYDDFAKCLNEKGAVMYGAMDWCKYTQAQKAMFGYSFKYLNYHNFDELKDIKVTPTWVINGQRYENVQSFEKLSAITGCKL